MIYKQLRPIDTRNFWPFILFFGQFSRIFHLLLVGMTIEPGNIGQQLLRLDRRSHSDRLALIRADSACFTARVKPYPAKNCVRCSMGEAFDRLRPPESGGRSGSENPKEFFPNAREIPAQAYLAFGGG
jgi:hypothetical protein